MRIGRTSAEVVRRNRDRAVQGAAWRRAFLWTPSFLETHPNHHREEIRWLERCWVRTTYERRYHCMHGYLWHPAADWYSTCLCDYQIDRAKRHIDHILEDAN